MVAAGKMRYGPFASRNIRAQTPELDAAGGYPPGVTETRLSAVPSWQPGRLVWPDGRTKLVVLGGIGSRTGDGSLSFAGVTRFLAERGGYRPDRDVLEATYAGDDRPDGWQPRPYGPADTRRPIFDSAAAVAGTLDWYREALPSTTRLCVLGYSLGGVVAFDGATMAVARDRAAWRDRLAAVITVASPLRGCNAGPFMHWAWLATGDPDPLGAAGTDLDQRWQNAAEQARVTRRAVFLRDAGVQVLTYADPDDAVVRPDEALLPAAGQTPADLLVSTERVRRGSYGHGAILDEPALWQRILAAVGHQVALPAPPPKTEDPIERELQALKSRLRAEGRIR